MEIDAIESNTLATRLAAFRKLVLELPGWFI
jgi:hypothetical protein